MSKRLLRIQASGLKNHENLDLEIGHCTMLAGPNGAGKSGILSALKLSALGYDPELNDKRLLAVRTQLAAGTANVETGVVFDDGFAVARSFGASLVTRVAPPKREKTNAEMQHRINSEIGDFVLAMDIRELTGLTPEKRREYAFGLLPRDRAKLTEEQFQKSLSFADQPPPLQRAIHKLWLDHVLAKESAVEGLASAIDHANAKYLEAVQDKRSKEHHLDELRTDLENAELSAVSGSYDPAVIERLQGDIEAAEAELSEIRITIRTAEESHRQAEKEYERILAEVSRYNILVARQNEGDVYLQSQREQLAALGEDVDDAALTEAVDKALEIVRLALEAEREQVDARDASQALLAEHKAELAGEQAALRRVEGADFCPTCGSAASLDEFRKQTREAIRRLERAVGAATAALEKEEAALGELRRAREEADTRVSEARQDLNNVERARAHRVNVKASIERAEASLRQIAADLATIGSVETPVQPQRPAVPDVAPLQTKIEALRAAVRAENAKAVSGSAPETIRQQIVDAEAEVRKAEARAEALKDLHKRLQVLRGEVIRGMLAPVERTAREILHQIDPSKEFQFQYDREGREVLDFGFEKDGVYRTLAAASNGESAILVSVLLAALLADLKPKWRCLILDNAEAIDDDPRTNNRRKFMEALAKISDRFDNILLAACGASALEEVPGWVVIDVAEVTGSLRKEMVAA